MLAREAVSSIEIVIFKRYLTISDSIFQAGLRDEKEIKITVRDKSPYFVEFRDKRHCVCTMFGTNSFGFDNTVFRVKLSLTSM